MERGKEMQEEAMHAKTSLQKGPISGQFQKTCMNSASGVEHRQQREELPKRPPNSS